MICAIIAARSCGLLVQTNLDHWLDAVDPVWAGEDALLLSSMERRNAAVELYATFSLWLTLHRRSVTACSHCAGRMNELLAGWAQDAGCSQACSDDDEGEDTCNQVGAKVVVAGSDVDVTSQATTTQGDERAEEARPRTVGEAELEGWMRVLTTPPVLNPATLYTTIMSASLTATSTSPQSDATSSSSGGNEREAPLTSPGLYLSLGVSAAVCRGSTY
jgi:hypothetical protein